MFHNPVTISALQGELFVVVFEKKSIRSKNYESYVSSVARKNGVNIRNYYFRRFFVTQNFRNRVLTYLWERDVGRSLPQEIL